MKALSISRMCLIVAVSLIVGLMATWSVAVPHQISGYRIVGNSGCGCSGWEQPFCGNMPGLFCYERVYQCTGSDPDNECKPKPGYPNVCLVEEECVNRVNVWCDGAW